MNAVLVLIALFAFRLIIPLGVLLLLGTWMERKQERFL